MRSGGAGREWREESAPVDARQGRRCRVLSLRRRDPGEWSGLGDESPEAAVSAGAKPSPTATTDPRQNGAGTLGRERLARCGAQSVNVRPSNLVTGLGQPVEPKPLCITNDNMNAHTQVRGHLLNGWLRGFFLL